MDAKRFDRRVALLAACATVGFGLLQGARLLDANTGPYSDAPFSLWGLFVDGATFITVALLSYQGRLDRITPILYAALSTSAAYAVLVASGVNHPAILACAQTAAGMGWALNILCWMAVFTSWRPRHAILMVSAGYVIDVVIQPMIDVLVPGGHPLVLLVVFALSAAALCVCCRNNDYIAQRMKSTTPPATTMAEAYSRTRRAIASTFSFSFTCGFIVQVDVVAGLQYAQTTMTAIICIVVSVLMLAIVFISKAPKVNIDYLCPIVALCLASVLLYRVLGLGDDAFAGSLMTTLLITSFVMLWLMLVSEAYERKLPAFFLLGLALGVARLSVWAGRCAADAWTAQVGVDVRMVLVCGIWVLMAATSCIFYSYVRYTAKQRAGCFDRMAADVADGDEGEGENALEDVGMAPKSAAAVSVSAEFSPKDDQTSPFDSVGSLYKLSRREREIVEAFACGRSARAIADHFVLSEHTVKTHLRRAYAKMGVHSRQELLDLVEEVRAEALKLP